MACYNWNAKATHGSTKTMIQPDDAKLVKVSTEQKKWRRILSQWLMINQQILFNRSQNNEKEVVIQTNRSWAVKVFTDARN